MKTTSTASIDEKIKALHELKAEQAKRQHAKIIAVLKDPNRTVGDIKRAFRNSWFHWIADLPTEVLETRMRAGEAVEPTPTPIAENSAPTAANDAVEPQPEISKSQARAVPPTPPPPSPPPAAAPSVGGGLCITFINKGTPIFYAYEPNGTITLCDHSGTLIKVDGKMFQARLDRGESADEVAQALWRESRGEKNDHFDGPILYRDRPVY
jgi:hypothetical protein